LTPDTVVFAYEWESAAVRVLSMAVPVVQVRIVRVAMDQPRVPVRVRLPPWIAEPKEGGKRRRTMFGYEKGLIWGTDNYRTNAALVNLALASGASSSPDGGATRPCSWPGRPSRRA
jgi:hypothetical protein